MLTKRIIPCLDVHGGKVVKGVHFKNLVEIGDPCERAQKYCLEGADEIVFYDITASVENRRPFLDTIKATARNITIPLTVGGGVLNLDDFYRLLSAGADKISINTGALINPKLISEAAKRFGSQCVVLSIDTQRDAAGQWRVYSKGGRENTGICAQEWAKRGTELGAGEIVVNSIDKDGVVTGYDLDITSKIAKLTSVPVIASGGAGALHHFLEAFTKGDADGALAASVFHKEILSIADVKHHLAASGIPIRPFKSLKRSAL